MFASVEDLVKDNMQYTIISNVVWEAFDKRLSRNDIARVLNRSPANLRALLLHEGVKRPGTVIAISKCFARVLVAAEA